MKSGWVDPQKMEGETLVKLLRLHFVVSNSMGQVRLNIEDDKVLKQLRRSSEVFRDQLEYAMDTAKIVSRDLQKSNEAGVKMQSIKDRLNKVPKEWPYVVAIGWWKMLENSGMPAQIDDVLADGFSPRDWLIIATRGAPDLALHLARKHGDIKSFEETKSFLSTLGVSLSEGEFLVPIGLEKLNKIAEILRWEDIENQVPLNVQKAIGFAWFCYMVWEREGLVPVTPPACSHLSLEARSITESLTGAREEEFRLAVSSLTGLGLYWAPGLITMPELI